VYSPCRYCDKRKMSCHSSCEEYKEFSDKRRELNERIRQEKAWLITANTPRVRTNFIQANRKEFF